jgi:hypothetical protein
VKTRKHTQVNEPAQPVKVNEPVVANKPDTQDAKRDDAETKRKLTLNSPVSPKVRTPTPKWLLLLVKN